MFFVSPPPGEIIQFDSYFSTGLKPSTSNVGVEVIDKKRLPSWELTYPLPKVLLKMMCFSRLVGYVSFPKKKQKTPPPPQTQKKSIISYIYILVDL